MQPPTHPATDLVVAMAIAAVSAALFIGAASLPPPRWEPLGSAAVPRALGALLALFAALLALGALRRLAARADTAAFVAERQQLLRGLGVLGTLITYVLAMDRFDAPFVAVTPVFVACIALLIGGWSWRRLLLAVLGGAVLSATLILTFTHLFYINLP